MTKYEQFKQQVEQLKQDRLWDLLGQLRSDQVDRFYLCYPDISKIQDDDKGSLKNAFRLLEETIKYNNRQQP